MKELFLLVASTIILAPAVALILSDSVVLISFGVIYSSWLYFQSRTPFGRKFCRSLSRIIIDVEKSLGVW